MQCQKCGEGDFYYEYEGDIICGHCGYTQDTSPYPYLKNGAILSGLLKAIRQRAKKDARCHMCEERRLDCWLYSNPYLSCEECKQTAWEWLRENEEV